jgi:hypothetical protein
MFTAIAIIIAIAVGAAANSSIRIIDNDSTGQLCDHAQRLRLDAATARVTADIPFRLV